MRQLIITITTMNIMMLVLGCHAPRPLAVNSAHDDIKAVFYGREIEDNHKFSKAVFAIRNTFTIFCTATAITPRILLTAAHCLDPKESTFTITSPHFNKIGVLGYIHHPDWPTYQADKDNWIAQNKTADVALLILKSPLPTDSIFTTMDFDFEVADSSIATIVGYGINEDSSYALGRRYGIIESPILRIGETRITSTPNSIILTKPTNEAASTACSGDSGGPLYVKKADDTFVQIGIVNTSDADCLARNSFLKISSVKDWLLTNIALAEEIIQNENAAPLPIESVRYFKTTEHFIFDCSLDISGRNMCQKKYKAFIQVK